MNDQSRGRGIEIAEVDDRFHNDLEAAIDYLEDRLLGPVPDVLIDLDQAVSDAWWGALESRGGSLRIVGSDGGPLAASTGERPDEAELAQVEAELAEMAAWEASAEGRAEIEREKRFAAFRTAHGGDTAAQYRAWLDRQAKNFARNRAKWWRQRRGALKAAFEAHEKREQAAKGKG